MSTGAYLVAHRALPIQASSQPEKLWATLAGPDWSTWLAMIGMEVKQPVRGIGVEGAPLGKAVTTRDGVEMIALYFPKPIGPGEPLWAIVARKAGETALRSFVFEQGVTIPAEPVRVVMAEWRMSGPLGPMRIRYDTLKDESLDACARAVVSEMNGAPAPAATPRPPSSRGVAPRSVPSSAPSTGNMLRWGAMAVLVGVAFALWIYARFGI